MVRVLKVRRIRGTNRIRGRIGWIQINMLEAEVRFNLYNEMGTANLWSIAPCDFLIPLKSADLRLAAIHDCGYKGNGCRWYCGSRKFRNHHSHRWLWIRRHSSSHRMPSKRPQSSCIREELIGGLGRSVSPVRKFHSLTVVRRYSRDVAERRPPNL
jgi:hypothetical protein